MHIIPHNLLSDERMWAHSCCLKPPHRSRTGTTGWGAWRMLWRVRERSRPSSPSQLWVAGPLSPYNVFTYLFCTKLLLYSKNVTFDPVPWFIICVRLGPSTPGDYVRARVLVPRNPGVTQMCMGGTGIEPTVGLGACRTDEGFHWARRARTRWATSRRGRATRLGTPLGICASRRELRSRRWTRSTDGN
jgi:hypothetical protein